MVGIAGAAETTEDEIAVGEVIDCDVVVVGAGMAGLCAALAGAEKGLNVVLLEKLGFCGGTSATTEGMFGAHSKLQAEQGFADDTDAYFQAIEEFAHWTNNPRICRRWLEYSSDTVDWVMDHGVTFGAIQSNWSTVPTWHMYTVRGGQCQQLEDAAVAAGAHLIGCSPVLWVNQDAKRFTTEGLMDTFVACGECRSTQPVNFNVIDFDFLKAQCEGIICDCSSDAPAGTPFPNGIELMDEYVAGDDFAIWKADTIEELAEQMGLDPVALRDTVDHYNEMCENGRDDFLKDPKYLIPVKTPPFYGAKMNSTFANTVGFVE